MTLIPAKSDHHQLSCYDDILCITDILCSSYLIDAIFCIHVESFVHIDLLLIFVLLQCNIMLAIYASICNRNLHVNVYVPYCGKKVYALCISVCVCIFLHITSVVPKLQRECDS